MKTMEPKSSTTKKVVFGSAGLSLALHFTIFLMVGGAVVVEYARPRNPMAGEPISEIPSEQTAEETPEAPTEPEAETTEPAPAPQATSTVDSTNPIDVVSTASLNPTFQMPTAGSLSVTGMGKDNAPAESESADPVKPGKAAQLTSFFGNIEPPSESSLQGTLYDLKQSKNGTVLVGRGPEKYIEALKEFCKKDWNRVVLSDYFKVKKPLYTTQIYVPSMNAGESPKAFKVEKDVKPSQWVILYEGSFASPKNGDFRFVGYADDILVVRVDGMVVLNGSLADSWAAPNPSPDSIAAVPGQEIIVSQKLGNGNTAYGTWVDLKAGQPHKIEILLGEWPGGGFSAYLFIEQKGKKYKTGQDGRPILPIFRVADTKTDISKFPKWEYTPQQGEPLFDPDGPIFGVTKP